MNNLEKAVMNMGKHQKRVQRADWTGGCHFEPRLVGYICKSTLRNRNLN